MIDLAKDYPRSGRVRIDKVPFFKAPLEILRETYEKTLTYSGLFGDFLELTGKRHFRYRALVRLERTYTVKGERIEKIWLPGQFVPKEAIQRNIRVKVSISAESCITLVKTEQSRCIFLEAHLLGYLPEVLIYGKDAGARLETGADLTLVEICKTATLEIFKTLLDANPGFKELVEKSGKETKGDEVEFDDIEFGEYDPNWTYNGVLKVGTSELEEDERDWIIELDEFPAHLFRKPEYLGELR